MLSGIPPSHTSYNQHKCASGLQIPVLPTAPPRWVSVVPHITSIRGVQVMHTRSNLPTTCTSELRPGLSLNTSRSSEKHVEGLGFLSWLVRRPWARHRTRRLEPTHQEHNQRLAWGVQVVRKWEDRIFAAEDAAARARGWQISRPLRGFGRVYRDPRWDLISACEVCNGDGGTVAGPCLSCGGHGTIRQNRAIAPPGDAS